MAEETRSTTGTSTRRVLIVGCWAKEQITIEQMKRLGDVEAFAYLETPNPAILSQVGAHRIGDLEDAEAIVELAREVEPDTVLITTAAPLAAGAADALEDAGFRTFGPRRAAARLEFDKGFARDLLKRARIDASPVFRLCETAEEADSFAADLDWDVAVKPVGLTDGLGVRVAGDHLEGPEDVRAAIRDVLYGPDGGAVLIEERIQGQEFTVQCFVHGDTLVPTPPVQDFKRLLPGDRGPNTGSMGSYACADGLLPFLVDDDLEIAMEVMRGAVGALRELEGVTFTGFLYGQFMRTAAGIRLVEFNVRPGDPEWMNTVTVLEDSVLDVVDAVLDGRDVVPRVRERATVCKYLTPPAYPAELGCVLEAEHDPDGISDCGCRLYHSCGLVDGRLEVGSERGFALIAEGDTAPEACARVEKAISEAVRGTFRHRPDIGTETMMDAKKRREEKLHGTNITVREARHEDIAAVAQLMAVTEPLEEYPVHLVEIVRRYGGDTFWIAERGGEILGWVMGLFAGGSPDRWFLWQIGVRPTAQRFGVGRRLLEHAEDRLADRGCERIEVTVDPDNAPSLALFEGAGYSNVSHRSSSSIVVGGRAAVRDHYGPARHFVVFEKKIASEESTDSEIAS